MGDLNWRAYFAEMIGVFALCFVAMSAKAGEADLVGQALANGLVIGTMIFAFGAISRAHFNPAVTISLMMLKKIDLKDSVFYIVFQVIGGILGALAASYGHAAAIPKAEMLVFGDPAVTGTAAIVIEAILTFLLMTVILGAAFSPKGSTKHPGFAIGLTVTLCILAGGHLTEGTMNPARYFGPVIASGEGFAHAMIYVLGPLLGAITAGIAYTLIHRPMDAEA